MASTKAVDRSPDLREFIKENDQRVYDFCAYFLASDNSVDELVLSVFREFGESFNKGYGPLSPDASKSALRVHLFQIAWAHVQAALHQSLSPALSGRDTRVLKSLETDLLNQEGEVREQVRERLGCVDPELRAPVILRDILRFEDEETARILGLRWGVYRHRLHRGRLDFKDSLKGYPVHEASFSTHLGGDSKW